MLGWIQREDSGGMDLLFDTPGFAGIPWGIPDIAGNCATSLDKHFLLLGDLWHNESHDA